MEKRWEDKTNVVRYGETWETQDWYSTNSRTEKRLQEKYLSAEKRWADKTNKVRTY